MKTLLWGICGSLALSAASALACSCIGPGTPKAELDRANTVMQATVEEIKQVSAGEHGWKQNLVKFKVEQSWKGLGPWHRTMVVRSSASGASCGYGFKTGESYVVYASLNPDGELTTSLCTRNNLTVKAADDLKELGEGIKPR